MSMRSVAKCAQETIRPRSKILSGEGTTVDYFAIIDDLIANGHVPPEERDEHIRATMNFVVATITADLVLMYHKDVEKFKAALPKYLDFVLDPVYDELAPEVALSTVISFISIPRRFRSEVDDRSDLLIHRINMGGVYLREETVNPYVTYIQNRQKDKQ